MAQYTRFEIYLPVHYTVRTIDRATGVSRQRPYALGTKQIEAFLRACRRRYGGVTRVHPRVPAMYKGWWQPDPHSRVEIDHLTSIFVLVRIDQEDDAIRFFERWRQRLAERLHQQVILVTYYPVQTIGDYL